MLTTNQYIRQFTYNKEESPELREQILELRSKYERSSNKLKRKLDRAYVKQKNNMTNKDWWDVITFNIIEGSAYHRKHTETATKRATYDVVRRKFTL